MYWCGVSIIGIVVVTGISPSSNVTISDELGEMSTNTKLQITQVTQNLPAPPVNPQPDPNRERFPQPIPQPQAPKPEQQQPILPETLPTKPAPTQEQPLIPVKKIEVSGSTIFKPEEIQTITAPYEGKDLTLEELRKVADAITQLYLERGYITSRAILASQQIIDGVVKIVVVEGSLETIEVEGAKRIDPNYIRSRLLLGAGVPLSTAALENQLRLLRIDPLFESIEASLRASDKLGKSILTVRVKEAKPLITNFSIDNYSPPSVGSERIGAFFLYRNLTGIGDEISASYYKSLGESNVYDLSYRVPINAMNGTLQVRFAPNNNEIVQQPFRDLGIRGKSQLYEISYRQPLVRTLQEEFALSLGFTHQRSQTFTAEGPTPFGFGSDEQGITRTSVFKFGQDYLRRDIKGAWVLRSQFSFGTSLFKATTNDDPIPDSRFVSWMGQVQRLQRLNNDHLLIVQADVQLTPDSLLPSQQFVIGGGLSLRGFRQNARSGDIGFRFSVENRYTIQRDSAGLPILQFAPFLDLGAVKNVGNNPNTLPDDKFLASIGLGLLWEILPGLNVRVDYALPLVKLSDKGNNAQDSGLYFSVNYFP
ncbi:MAG: ShlB/FhaC/HecB family hemolysin secretion/activation protein [Oscillatoriaceae bacterium SKW80]|nr:ShlB/FhaC/HecB family hemolysin secretion/activation protein [Oscillatoriaceae bacterium SKYG93]MCX8120373.1 ShlB/FhaC/HecB family hemolysin secretion/activation protein [Oscillatoriaceae bacterium SKW80]MDW8453299.1 ShlB/FhaC/HecB family hemolysin secretion/activation protein [Oscillatoriaceae cyanobacterium SKYGB_i_bin93]HIK27259.1 ShlB/FhaC/HecB family hemolysin secretion/activation protein [Oscillatoriaceae cyanobacterium M7585_C2015_266]